MLLGLLKETALGSLYVAIIKKFFDVQLRYHSQFKISVSLEEHQGFQKLPLKVSYKTSRFLRE